MKNISIIVLFHNNENFDIVIDALLKQKIADDEIIIVNDHSDPQHLEALNRYTNNLNIHIINSDKRGNRAHNRNYGAQIAKNELLLFVDGDMVLMDNCMQLIRISLCNGYVGAFGNIIQSEKTPEQMQLFAGFDYLEFLKRNPKLEEFFRYNLANDKRSSLIHNTIMSRNEWQYYYSGYCAAEKTAFFACGQFNEAFQGWGAEDVELGYRLEKQGNLSFLSGAYAYHLSHPRDLYSILLNNKKNLYLFYSQQPNFEIELFLTYNLDSHTIEIMNYIKGKLIQLNLSDKHRLTQKGELSVLPPSTRYQNGSVAYIDNNGMLVSLDLTGTSLPFNDNQFEVACLSTDIFCYPENISIRIIQECYRVAENVKIFKNVQRPRILWTPSIISELLQKRSNMDRTNYHAYMISDFNFSDEGEYYIVNGGLATKMPYIHIDNLPEIYPERRYEHTNYIVFDLTKGLTDVQIEKILKQYGLVSEGVYRISSKADQEIIRLSDTIYGELQLLNIPFVYLIKENSSIDTADIWWSYKNRQSDIIIHCQ